MPEKVDLHIHTTHSDGRLSPADAVEWAVEKKLSAIAITDHDTYDGYFEAANKAADVGIKCIPGVEITSNFQGRECHILAYDFQTDTDYLSDFLTKQKVARRNRVKGIIDTLQKQGLDIDYDEVRAEANGANMGRPHLARVLIDKGYVGNFNEAFMRYLGDSQLGEISNSYPEHIEVIRIIKNVGGACILAHPGRMFNDKQIATFIEDGIDGLECIHPSHNWKTQKKLTELCEKHNLLMTGGSDCHNNRGASYSHFGVVTLNAKHLNSLLRMTEQRKNIVDLKE